MVSSLDLGLHRADPQAPSKKAGMKGKMGGLLGGGGAAGSAGGSGGGKAAKISKVSVAVRLRRLGRLEKCKQAATMTAYGRDWPVPPEPLCISADNRPTGPKASGRRSQRAYLT